MKINCQREDRILPFVNPADIQTLIVELKEGKASPKKFTKIEELLRRRVLQNPKDPPMLV